MHFSAISSVFLPQISTTAPSGTLNFQQRHRGSRFVGHSWTTLVVIGRKLFHLAHIYVFINFLSKLFDKDTAKALLEKDLIGTTKDVHTIFYQFDTHDRCRSVKIIPYNPETGHDIKDDR